MNLMNITKISRYCGLFIALFALAAVLPIAHAQDFIYFELGPKPPNVVPDDWSTNRAQRNVRTAENPTTWMPDANLRAAVAAELKACDPPLTLTKTNITVLSSIDADGTDLSPITNLNGLEYATNLTWLNLRVNGITNVAPLSGLTNLVDLSLESNNITNITSLSTLVNLERLSLALNSNNSNSLSDISALSSMTNMMVLNLSGNNINDINDLSQMTSLTGLYLGSNNLSNLSNLNVLSNFSNLERLSLYNNNFNTTPALDISDLADLTNLTFLHLGRNSISDISDLADLTNLTDLYLESNNITDFSSLSNLTNLETLQLSFNNIGNDDLTHLSGLTQLIRLYLEQNEISDISHLSGLVNLEQLDLSWNDINDIRHLANMLEMRWLELSGNSINTIGVLVDLLSLERVDLSTNPVLDTPSNRLTVNTLRARDVEVIIDGFVTNSSETDEVDTVQPNVRIDVPTDPRNDSFDVSVVFTESVSGFELTELTLDSTAIASISSTEFTVSDDNTTYTAEITPITSGDVTFSVAAAVARDAGDNLNTAATSQTVTIDLIAPGVSLTVPSGAQTEPFDITVVFNEEVKDFELSELVLDPTTLASITSESFTITDNTTYTATITPVKDGNVAFSVAAGVATDTAGNANTAATTKTVTVDADEPEVSISVPSGTQNDAFEATFTFTQPITGFVASDVVLGGLSAEISEPQQDSMDEKIYTATITPTVTTPGNITIDVPAGAVTNDIGTPNAAAPRRTVSVDLPPNVSITVSSDVQNGPFEVTVVFSEAVSGFVQDELILDGNAMASITSTSFTTTDNISYTADITPTLSGDITFDVAASVATDDANLDNTAATQLTVTVDLFVEIPDRNLLRRIRNLLDLGTNASVTESQMASLTSITYDSQYRPNYRRIRDLTGLEYATNLETLQLRYNRISDPSPIANLTNLTILSLGRNNIDSISFVLNLTNLEELSLWRNDIKHISGLEDLTALRCLSIRHNPILNYAANRATRDILKERLGSKLKIDAFVDDETVPSVEISVPSGTQNAAFQVTFTFTEPVSGFDASDVVLGGLSAEITEPQQDSTDEMIYTAIITLIETQSGNITIDIPEDAVTDRGDNGNTAATTLTVPVDLPPRVNFDIPSGTQYGRFVVQIIFSEPVTSFIVDDLLISGTATAEVRLSTGSTTSVYNVRITPTSQGDLTITVPAEVARDRGYNWNITTSSESVAVALDFAVEVPDANLAAEFRDQLDLDVDDDITKSQILTLTAFDYILPPENERITNISGLEHATNLESLNLRGNLISNIDVLEDLTNLTTLNLKDNNLTDINPLAELTELTVLFLAGGNSILDTSPLYPLLSSNGGNLRRIDIDVSQYPPWDVNEDGSIDATDSALVTAALGQAGNAIVNPRTDVNGDGTVDQDDLTLVTDNLDTDGGAPSNSGLFALLDRETLHSLDRGLLESYLNTLRAESDGSLKYIRAIAILERVLEMTRPKETQLLANYPNPFNPETWIPYHLANASKVRITIYDVHGTVVRRLDLGHQREGYYTNHSRAAYWDGRNDVGERIASGIYFYQLQADNVSLLRKMVILK